MDEVLRQFVYGLWICTPFRLTFREVPILVIRIADFASERILRVPFASFQSSTRWVISMLIREVRSRFLFRSVLDFDEHTESEE